MGNLKRFVNTPEFNEAFIEFINMRLSQAQRVLEQAIKPEEIYRSQGQIFALRRLLNIREDINSMEK